jgi:chemotaxis response regulator CheB
MLGKHPDFQVVGEASDGLEAVQKADKLQPDLIVLDLGLPSLNGLEGARRIRRLSSKSKIIVASQESSAEVVREALRSGALAYVTKACLFTDTEADVCWGSSTSVRSEPMKQSDSPTLHDPTSESMSPVAANAPLLVSLFPLRVRPPFCPL